MQPGKAIVLAEVLKQTMPFKASFIYKDCDTSRQLVYYHLDQMVGRGFLEKSGMYFSIANKDALINEIKQTGEPQRERKLKPTRILDQTRVDSINQIIEYLVICRILKTPLHKEIENVILDDIDATIDGLRNAKQYIHRKTYRRLNASWKLYDKNFEIYEYFKSVISPVMSQSEFISKLNEIVDEVKIEEDNK